MKDPKKRYERAMKLRRIMAMLGVIIIALLYVYFFFLASINDPDMNSALFAAFAATIIVPVLMYVFSLLAKNLINYYDDGNSASDSDSKDASSK